MKQVCFRKPRALNQAEVDRVCSEKKGSGFDWLFKNVFSLSVISLKMSGYVCRSGCFLHYKNHLILNVLTKCFNLLRSSDVIGTFSIIF